MCRRGSQVTQDRLFERRPLQYAVCVLTEVCVHGCGLTQLAQLLLLAMLLLLLGQVVSLRCLLGLVSGGEGVVGVVMQQQSTPGLGCCFKAWMFGFICSAVQCSNTPEEACAGDCTCPAYCPCQLACGERVDNTAKQVALEAATQKRLCINPALWCVARGNFSCVLYAPAVVHRIRIDYTSLRCSS